MFLKKWDGWTDGDVWMDGQSENITITTTAVVGAGALQILHLRNKTNN